MRKRLIFLSGRLAPSVLTALTTALLTRLLNPAEYGLYAFGSSIIFFLGLAAFEWLGLSLVRMGPMAKHPELLFETIVTCFGVLVLFLTAATVALFMFVGGLEKYEMFALAAMGTTFASAWFELKLRLPLSELQERRLFFTSVGRSVATAVFVGGRGRAHQERIDHVISQWRSSVARWSPCSRATIGAIQPPLRCQYRSLLYFGFPLAISVGLAAVLVSINKWMLQWLLGSRAVG
jgi:O-antigen/teichoic acid export membrane protein